MKKLATLCICSALLGGCARGHWDYGAMPRQEAMQKAYDCQYMANMQAKGTGYFAGSIAESQFRQCMESRGFVWIDDNPRQRSGHFSEPQAHGSFSGTGKREMPFNPNFDPYAAQGIPRPEKE